MLAPEERWEPRSGCNRVGPDVAAVAFDLMAERGLTLIALLDEDGDAAQLLAQVRRQAERS
jgi:hypothetical protein